MKIVKVNASKKYEVIIGKGLIESAGKLIKEKVDSTKICIVTDDIVDSLYGKKTEKILKNEGFSVEKYVIQNGEQSKNAENLLKIVSFLAENKFTRNDMLVALGGGVVGDLTGFCAATYMRGIRFIQMPTTLLAAVDSSVGGKTAVDLPQGKNLFGAFWQPSLVICDTDTLDTLPDEVFADGTAEVIKYGMIYDKTLFEKVKTGTWNREEVIARCVEIKRDIVNIDEFESGVRQILNFGHTFGHGVESLSDFKLSHGHCVAIGMAMIMYALVEKGEISSKIYAELVEALNKNNLSVTCDYDAESIYQKVVVDKKSYNGGIKLITVREIGKAEIEKTDLLTVKELIKTGVKCK